MKTEAEKKVHMEKCNYHMNSGICAKKSGYHGNVHVTYACDGQCKRMELFSKRKNRTY